MKQFLYRAALAAASFGLAAGLAAQSRPMLPAFRGWQRTQADVSDKSPWRLPPDQAAMLQEYGLRRVERDTYQRGDRKIEVDGYGFRDPYGSFGAFTVLRPADAGAFDIGRPREESGADNQKIFFTAGPWLIEVTMDQMTAMTASDMRALASQLPATADRQWPTLPYYLPRDNVIGNSLRYMAGPVGFASQVPWLPASAVGFDMGAEAVTAQYDFSNSALYNANTPLDLVIIAYPTPQIARTHLARLQKNLPAGVAIKRTGPDVVAVRGDPGAGQQLLSLVQYDANVSVSSSVPVGLNALPGIILGIFLLVGLIIAVAVVVGVISGGITATLRRRFPDRFQKLVEKRGVIRLNLE